MNRSHCPQVLNYSSPLALSPPARAGKSGSGPPQGKTLSRRPGSDLLMLSILPEAGELLAYQTLSQVGQSFVTAQANWDHAQKRFPTKAPVQPKASVVVRITKALAPLWSQ